MPELPEVETITRSLENILPGRKVQEVLVRYSGSLRGNVLDFQTDLCNTQIDRVWRRGKLILLDVNKASHLIFHLKMTGRLLYQSEPYLHLDKHTHLVFKLCNQGVLSFHDTRKFGYCAHLTSRELQRWPYFATLGPEPLTLDEEAFVAIFQKSKARIKAVLLDQRKIAGIGNIYADEALHVSGIHPATPCSWLAQETLQGLSFALKNVLLRSIGLGGSTLRDYVDSLGNRGRYQDGFLAYGRKGLPCTKCSTRLESCKVAGRTSVYCPSCQPMLDPE